MVRATSGEGGKGPDRRPCLTSREENDLRWALYTGEITREEFDEKMKEMKGDK